MVGYPEIKSELPSPLFSFVLGLVFLNGFQYLIFFAVQHFPIVVILMVSLLFLAFGLMFVFIIEEKWGTPAMVGALIGAGAFLLGLVVFDSYEVEPRTISGISIVQAPDYANYDIFYFKDVAPHPFIHGYHSECTYFKGKRNCSSSEVVPVVLDDWTPADPITLWISCPDILESGFECRMDSSALSRAGSNLASDVDEDEFPGIYANAIYDAEQKYGVISAPRAPVITWEPDPELTIAFNQKFAWGAVLFMNLVYLIILIVLKIKNRGNREVSSSESLQ